MDKFGLALNGKTLGGVSIMELLRVSSTLNAITSKALWSSMKRFSLATV